MNSCSTYLLQHIVDRRSALLIAFTLILNSNLFSQNACPLAANDTIVKCPLENEYETMGIQTVVGSTYTWYKNGARVAGPLPGDGNPTSFGVALRTANDAGRYTVEENLPNGTKICRFNQHVLIPSLPVAQPLTGAGPLCLSGTRILTLAASQPNVSYELYRDGDLWQSVHSTGTGPINFDVNPGTYYVRAENDTCPGVFRYFGNAVVTSTVDRPTINFTTSNSANLSWSGSGTFVVEYGGFGFIPGTDASAGGGTVFSTSSSPVTISGLSPGLLYDVYVRQLCQGGFYVQSEATHFKTDCATVSTFPYVEGFESPTILPPNIPQCWNELDQDGSFDWQTTTIQPRQGTKAINGSFGEYVVLPRFNLTGNKRLRFWVRSESPFSPYPCIVRISTTNNGRASFNTILLTDTLQSQGYEEKIIDLSAYPGNVYLSLSTPVVVKFDDFTVENRPACAGGAQVKLANASDNSASIKWTGTGTFIVEYGLANFTPGTGATNGAGGTVISNATSPQLITGLTPGVTYDVYIRQNCTGGGNGYSANTAKLSFTTFSSCAAAINVNANCSSITATMPAGSGIANFYGFYPNNSTGKATPGRELLYKFTPSTTGVYYIDATSTPSELSYFYKPVSAGCGNSGWIGIANVNAVQKYPIGLLQAATEYFLLIDNPSTSAITHLFKICRANVAPPAINNSCITTNTVPITPRSTKPEYLVDGNGNLVAALDFSTVQYSFGQLNASYSVNSLPVKYDNAPKEYLDRILTISTGTTLTEPIGIAFYFTNAELQRLINEPNDGIGDVATVNDLKITRDHGSCFGFSYTNSALLAPTSNGTYDANSRYIQFNTNNLNANGISTFYLHGGSEPLYNFTSVCPGDNVTFSVAQPGDNFLYQWQVDMGSGFGNIIPNEFYAGINTPILTLRAPPTSYYGNKYRCQIVGTSTVMSEYKTLKFAMTWVGDETTVWEDPRNWSCDSFGKHTIPDANVDVIIPNVTKKPVINSNVSCRSVRTSSGAILTITPGYKLTITGQ